MGYVGRRMWKLSQKNRILEVTKEMIVNDSQLSSPTMKLIVNYHHHVVVENVCRAATPPKTPKKPKI